LHALKFEVYRICLFWKEAQLPQRDHATRYV